MTRIIYMDCETQKWSDDVPGGFENVPNFLLSIMATHDTETKEERTWMTHNIEHLEPILAEADLVVGFNLKRFDYVLIQQYLNIDLQSLPTFDMLEEVELTLGKRLSLNNLAKNTLQIEKAGSGELAVKWWNRCELTKLEKYCHRDVKITKNLFIHGCKEGSLSYLDPGDYILAVLDTDYWAKKAREIVDNYKNRMEF